MTGVIKHTIAAFLAVALFAPFLWMLMDRAAPYTFTHTEITPSSIPQGGEIYIHFTVKQNRPACGPGLVYREFREEATGKLHTFDPVMRAEAPTVIDNKFTRIAKLPENITPGLVTYRGVACYTCNPVHSWLRWPVCTNTPTASFTVMAPKP